MPKEAKTSVSHLGKALGGINEPVGQKQDLNMECKPDQGKVQDKVCEQYKRLKDGFIKEGICFKEWW